jgi:hypothetical protein
VSARCSRLEDGRISELDSNGKVIRSFRLPTEGKNSEFGLPSLENRSDALFTGPERKECISNGGYCSIRIEENEGASSNNHFTEGAGGFQAPSQYVAWAREAADHYGLDENLVLGVMYHEMATGWYDGIPAAVDLNKSMLPMNINADHWGDTFGTREALKDPRTNIFAGADMLARIQRSLGEDASVRRTATLYQNLRADRVSEYGARVERYTYERPWEQTQANAEREFKSWMDNRNWYKRYGPKIP